MTTTKIRKKRATLEFYQIHDTYYGKLIDIEKVWDDRVNWGPRKVGSQSDYSCQIDACNKSADGTPRFYQLTTQGFDSGSRRYRWFNTLEEAKAVAQKWAKSRYYYGEED